MSTLLSVDGLWAGYGGTEVVRDVSLQIAPGEVVALLGANGAGKSTTLRAISGLVPAMRGAVTFLDQAVHGWPAVALARRGIVHVPEGRGIFMGLTVEEHFAVGPARRHGGAATAFELFPALEPLRSRRAGLLSGGEQQMLAIGRALAQQPKVLLLDEPSLGLAPSIVERALLPVIRSAADRGVGVLLVEQHVALALDIADSVVVLAHGDVAFTGSARGLDRHADVLRHAYLGRSMSSPDPSPDWTPAASPSMKADTPTGGAPT
jgi:branched-chain amino acid transport system ATP-binding protein